MKSSRVGGLWAQKQREGKESAGGVKTKTPKINAWPRSSPGIKPPAKGVGDARISTALTRLFPALKPVIAQLSETELRDLTTVGAVEFTFAFHLHGNRRKQAQAVAGTIKRFNTQRGLKTPTQIAKLNRNKL